MPLYRVRNVLEARGIKAFFNLDVGVTRGEIPEATGSEKLRRQLQQARQEIAKKDRQLDILTEQAKISHPEEKTKKASKSRPRPRYTYLVHDERKFAYLWVHKAACSSVKAALLPLFDLDPTPYERTLRDGKRHFVVHDVFKDSDHQVHKEQFLQGLANEYHDYFKFSFVRNPWDRLLSCYLDKIVRKTVPPYILTSGRRGGVEFYANMPFTEFVEVVCQIPDDAADGHFRPQHLTVCDLEGEPMADFVGRFENLSEDFAYVAKEIGAPRLELPDRNRVRSSKSSSRHYRDFYDKRLKDLVQQRFEKDVEIFGYSF